MLELHCIFIGLFFHNRNSATSPFIKSIYEGMNIQISRVFLHLWAIIGANLIAN